MRLLNRAADALLARLIPSDAAKAAACVGCTGVGGCNVTVQYRTDAATCKTYARCRYSGGTCPDGGWTTPWKFCGNYC
ncbi:hypothetical protein Afil01_28230 [Actinorhabdospora filicis]|uniref:Uncharacterized protein n=1 Tax=Actinorhabdospora filicis TaxID=1785913 RepID=A0A9W6SLK1_9ACTN|nr:hypothetical protein [Actinorhabdospora filicis]GLZ78016.1 hypothetical protein Afil01_28230 [Actinorhabdospora filicis]